MKKTFLSLALMSTLSLLASTSALAHSDNIISKAQVTKDVTYLASDSLKGRASFSAEIDQAADYISQRFNEIGLKPMADADNLKQRFSVFNMMPTSLAVTLNGAAITDESLAIASTLKVLSWEKSPDVNTHIVNEKADFRLVLRALNRQGGQHLVLVNSAHKKLFSRYQRSFARGTNKLSQQEQGAIVLVLTDINKINSFVISANTTISEKKLTNVVGILPGKSKADEIVLYSSHYDHLGINPEGKGDQVFNGADDDASGTSAVINLASYFAKQNNNERTLMFSTFTAEEIGGFGSRYFSEQLDPEKIMAMINIEMIGKPSKFGAGTMWMTGMDRSNLATLLNANLTDESAKIHADPYPKQRLFYRSDNATLARLGVPAHSFSSTQLDKDQHYHKVTDDINSLDLDSMHQVIASLAVATQGLVDGTSTPNRIDVNKVKGRGLIY
jgi:aminopeptidase YwaD